MGAVIVTLSGVSRPLAGPGVGDAVEPPAVVYTQSMQVLDLAATQLSGTPGVDATGDFYDVFPIEIPARGHEAAQDAMWWWVVMGDVCGKGMAAASVAASVRHAAHTVASDALDASAGGPVAPDPALLLHRLHDILMVRTGRRFVTAVAAVLRPDGHGGLVGRLASAGHEPALIRRIGGAVEVISAGGMLLGLVPRQPAPAVEVRIGAGEVMVVFTDGVTDARPGPGGECFGLERLTDALTTSSGQPVRAVVDVVTTSAMAYRRGFLGDDLAILAISPSV
jgi:serine phosphatase RsbU (regulator of sigma subunit)